MDRDMSEVHLWVLPLDIARGLQVGHLLDEGERDRAAGFRQRDDAVRYEAGRVLLRVAAADLLGRRAQDVRLTRHCPVCGSTEHGRPVVAGAGDRAHLSLTHGGDVIAVAAAVEPVGIDVEPHGRPRDLDGLAQQVLTAAERAAIGPAPRAAGASPFHDLWTLKEAFIKACGLTLDDLGEIDVLAALAGPAWIEHGSFRLLCRRLELAPGHAGALASSGARILTQDAVGAVRSLAASVPAGPEDDP
jgi:4'-phosphopantetheinyl transferase